MPPTPTSTFYTPGPNNTFIPGVWMTNDGATGVHQNNLSRDPESFPLNEYVQMIAADNPQELPPEGYYLDLSTDDPIRVVNLNDHAWPDGGDAPRGEGRSQRWQPFKCERDAFPAELPARSVEVADYNVLAANTDGEATKAMTSRTLRAITELTTAANWPTGTTSATVDALLSATGASWISSSTTQLYIQKSIQTVLQTINKNSGGAVNVRKGNITMVISPNIARQMAATAELQAYRTAHEHALISLENVRVWTEYGLPPYLYGVRVVVEDSVRVTSRRGASSTTIAEILGNQAVFLYRPAGLTPGNLMIDDEKRLSRTLGTMTLIVREDMTVETRYDDHNRRHDIRVVDDYDPVLTSPRTGYLIQSVIT